MPSTFLSVFINVTFIVLLFSCGTQGTNTKAAKEIIAVYNAGDNQKLEMLPTQGIEFIPEISGTYWYQGPAAKWDSVLWPKECRQISSLHLREGKPKYFELTWDGLTEHSSKHCISIRKIHDSTYRIVHVLAHQFGDYNSKDIDSTDYQFLGMGMVLERFYQQPDREDIFIDVKYESNFNRKDCNQGNY